MMELASSHLIYKKSIKKIQSSKTIFKINNNNHNSINNNNNNLETVNYYFVSQGWCNQNSATQPTLFSYYYFSLKVSKIVAENAKLWFQ